MFASLSVSLNLRNLWIISSKSKSPWNKVSLTKTETQTWKNFLRCIFFLSSFFSFLWVQDKKNHDQENFPMSHILPNCSLFAMPEPNISKGIPQGHESIQVPTETNFSDAAQPLISAHSDMQREILLTQQWQACRLPPRNASRPNSCNSLHQFFPAAGEATK